MPNLDFYAAGEDWPAVIEAVFELGLFRVFEAYSVPGHEVREFRAASEVPAVPEATHLALLVTGRDRTPSSSG